MRRVSLVSLVLVALVCFAALPLRAIGQSEPGAPMRVILPTGPGTLNLLARGLADRLIETLGRSVVVEQRPGAGGVIATDLVAKSAPDGRTVLLAYDAVATVGPFVYRQLPFDIDTDLKPVALVGFYGQMLVVSPALNVKDLAGLVAASKKKPLRFASTGNGSPSHLALAYLQQQTGLEAIHVPYKGAAPAIGDIIGGHIDAIFTVATATVPSIRSGQVRALGYSGRARSVLAPEVPTLIEAGLRDFEAGGAYIVFVPSATPEGFVTQLYGALKEAVARPEVRERFEQLDVVPAALNGNEAAQWIGRTRGRWGPLAKASGMKVD